MPASDYGSRAGTPGSNPSSRSFGGGGFSGGVGGNRSSNSGNTGLKTGSTIYGNTAFGPAGGAAVGYATRTGPMSGMGPSVGAFSNFRTPSGAPMVGGALQNRAVTARNPQQALGMLQALAGTQRPRVGGLLADEEVSVGEIPEPANIVPTAAAFTPKIPYDATLANFQPWWKEPVAAKYADPFKAPWPNSSMYRYEPLTRAGFANSYYGNPRLGFPTPATGLGNYVSPAPASRRGFTNSLTGITN